MSTAIGALAVRVVSDTLGFAKGMQGADKSAKAFEQRMASVRRRALAMGAAITGAAAAIFAASRRGAAAIDEYAKLAAQFDDTIGSVRGLVLAAEEAGVAKNTMAKAAQTLNQRIGEARRGVGAALPAFEKLGIEAEHLAGLPVNERFALIADRAQALNMSSDQLADTLRQLGLRQHELVGFLRQGGDAIRGATSDIESMGLAISSVDAAAVEASNDAIARLGLITESVQQRLAIALAPRLQQISEAILQAAKDTGVFESEIDSLVQSAITGGGRALEFAGKIVGMVEGEASMRQFGVIGYMLFGRKGALLGAALGKIFEQARAGMRMLGVGVNEEAAELARLEAEIERTTGAMERGMERGKVVTDRTTERLEAMKERVLELRATMGDEARADFEEFFTGGEEGAISFGDRLQDLGRILQDSAGAQVAALDTVREAQEGALEELEERIDEEELARREQLERQLEQLRHFLMSQEELEVAAHEERMAQLADMHDAELLAEEEFYELREELMRQHQERMSRFAEEGEEERLTTMQKFLRAQTQTQQTELQRQVSGLSGALQSMFGQTKKGSQAMGALKRIESMISAYAWGSSWGGPPAGAAAAAAAAAAQAASMQQLSSQQIGSGGGGGSSAPAAAAPAPAAVAQPDRVIRVQGVRPGDLFTGDVITQLAQGLEEAAGDGRTRIMVAA